MHRADVAYSFPADGLAHTFSALVVGSTDVIECMDSYSGLSSVY